MPRDVDLEEEKGYTVIVPDPVEEKISQLDKSTQKEASKKIHDLKDNPVQKGKRLTGKQHPRLQVKSGKYRVWYLVRKDRKEVQIDRFLHKDEAKKLY